MFPQCQASTSSRGGNAAGGSSGKGGKGSQWSRERKARQPGLFEVNVVTPPPRSLGIYALPPLTHNGEEVDIDQGSFVVTSVFIRYRLEKGKYVRDHSRLDVEPTGRWLLNKHLDGLMDSSFIPPAEGLQD